MDQTVMTLKYKKRFHIGMQCKYLWLNQNETFNTYFSREFFNDKNRSAQESGGLIPGHTQKSRAGTGAKNPEESRTDSGKDRVNF